MQDAFVACRSLSFRQVATIEPNAVVLGRCVTRAGAVVDAEGFWLDDAAVQHGCEELCAGGNLAVGHSPYLRARRRILGGA